MEKTIIKTTEVCCGKCFFAMAAKAPDGSPVTRCNKGLPRVLGGFVNAQHGIVFQTFTVWPTVHPVEDWCGKFKAKSNGADDWAKLGDDKEEKKT